MTYEAREITGGVDTHGLTLSDPVAHLLVYWSGS
jgi:hypothetical protein